MMSEKEAVQPTTPKLLWTAELGQTVSQPPLILGDMLLIATQPSGPVVQHSQLQAIDLNGGEVSWQNQFQYALISGMAASRLATDRREVVIVSSSSSDFLQGSGAVQAFCQRGEIDWTWQGEGQNYSAPAVAGYQVYVTAGAQTLVIVCPEETGCYNTQQIKFEAKASQGAPAIHNGIAYIPCRSPELLAIDLQGEVRWHFHLQTDQREWLDKTPLLSQGHLFSASSQGSLLALDAKSGTMIWRTMLGEGRPLSQPVLGDHALYVGSRQGISAVDKRNGTILWSFPTARPVSAAPLVAGDQLYFTSEDHFIYAVDIQNGAERWRHEMSRRIEMPPVLSATALVVVDRGGNVVAFEAPTAAPGGERQAGSAGQDPAVVAAFQRQTAEAHEANDEPLAAARVWQEIGQLERAAEQFELAEAWLEAAELWWQMDRYGKRAQALRKHARVLSRQETVDDEQKAAAWEKAAQAYAETGQRELRIQCEREVARYRRQPILELEVDRVDLVIGAWSKLNYTIYNKGFGIARHVDLILKGDQFDGQEARTQTIVSLNPEQSHAHWIDVSPKSHGSSVPMQLAVEYIDKGGKIHVLDKLLNFPVAGPTSPLTQSAALPDTADLLAQLPSPDGRDLPELRDKLVQNFNRDELKEVIFELGLLEDNFDEKISVMAKELILALARHGRLAELVDIVQQKRPQVEW